MRIRTPFSFTNIAFSVALLVFMLAASSIVFSTSVVPDTRVSDFTLDDQFEQPQAVKFAGKHTIVMTGDRKGADLMRVWEEKLTKAFGSKVQIVRVAYFKGMPFFVPRGLARNEIKDKYPKSSVLCDWDGTISGQFGYTGGAQLYYCDPNAIIRATASGEWSVERSQLFVGSIQTFLH